VLTDKKGIGINGVGFNESSMHVLINGCVCGKSHDVRHKFRPNDEKNNNHVSGFIGIV